MSDIFQEVDEDVRRDQAAAFWNTHQNTVLGAAFALVLLTGGWRYWQHWQLQAAQAAGARFEQALKLEAQGKSDEAKAALDPQAPGGYQTLSRFFAAGIAAKKDPKAGAAAFYALASDPDPLFAEAAKLRAALVRIDAGEADKAKAELELLSNGAYRSPARLGLAALAFSAKDYKTAGLWLDAVVTDFEAPRGDRETAQRLLSLVAAQGIKPKS